MKMVEVDIETLRPNPWNTNVVTPENEEKIKASILRLGMFRPIIVRTLEDGTKEILGGEHRWSVAKSLGYTKVPIVDLGTVSDKKAKEIGLVDNGRYGEDDTLQLAELLKELGSSEEFLEFLPYTGDEIDSIFSATSIAFEDLEIPEGDETLPEIPVSKTAQTHQIMRFKVPIEDAEFLTRQIEATMKAQNFTGDESMINAGNALVHLLRSL